MDTETSTMETPDWAIEFTAEELADMDYAETMRGFEDGDRRREIDWLTLRNEIMIRGGIAAGDVTRHYIPGQLYRLNGLPVDVIARDLADEGFGSWTDGDEFLTTLWRMFESYQGEWNRLRRDGSPRWTRAAA